MYFYFAPIVMSLLSIFVNLFNDRKADLLLLSAIVLYVVTISGFRFHADIDYEPYFELYSYVPRLTELSLDDLRSIYGEPGYLFFTSLIKSTGSQFFVVTFIASLISISVKSFVALKLVRNASFVVAIYLCLSFITIEFIQMRWAVATAFLTLAYYSLYEQHRKSSFLLFLIAVSFHYFSIVFVLLSYFIRSKGYRRYFLFLLLSFVFSISTKLSDFSLFFGTDSDIYLIRRFFRYLIDPESSVGVFSYLKILFYVVTVFLLMKLKNCRIDFSSDNIFIFLFKSSFVFLSAALCVTFVPIFFFRTMVMADLFSIMLISYMITRVGTVGLKMSLVYVISILFSVWCYLDVSNYSNAQRILPYESWIEFAL